MPPLVVLALLGGATATLGTLGGLGGAVLLVPALIVAGVDAGEAAPLGLLSVAAGSVAAAEHQLREGVVHHRLGVTLESAASAGAVVGALASGALPDAVLRTVLAAVAVGVALTGVRRRGVRNLPQAEFVEEVPGEWPGTLAGSYGLDAEIVPYQARRIPAGLAAMSGAGVIAGLAGVGGGFIKTPVLSELMHVPVKVAAATVTFTVGITAASALAVFAGQGRIMVVPGAAVVVGALAGGWVGARVQGRLAPALVRRVLTVALLVVAVVLVVAR